MVTSAVSALVRNLSTPSQNSKLRIAQNLATYWFLYQAFKFWRRKGAKGVFKAILGTVISATKAMPGAGSMLDAQIDKELDVSVLFHSCFIG